MSEVAPRISKNTTEKDMDILLNGIKDTINVVTGEYVQRVGEIVLDGSDDEGWTYYTHSTDNGWHEHNNTKILDYFNVTSTSCFVTYTLSKYKYYGYTSQPTNIAIDSYCISNNRGVVVMLFTLQELIEIKKLFVLQKKDYKNTKMLFLYMITMII